MELGTQGDLIILHEMIRLLPKVRNKYWKLGKSISQATLSPELKNTFFSLGNDLDKFLKLSNTLGVVKDETSPITNTK